MGKWCFPTFLIRSEEIIHSTGKQKLISCFYYDLHIGQRAKGRERFPITLQQEEHHQGRAQEPCPGFKACWWDDIRALLKEGQTLPHCWGHHLQTQLEQQQPPCHGLTANGPLGPSEEETQADGCLDDFSSSGHQVPRFGPLHFGEENGNHPQGLPHGAGSKERIQGGEWTQVGHHGFHLWVSFVKPKNPVFPPM